MMTFQDTNTLHSICPAQRFCVDFGVYRGEAINHLEDLNLGDMYQLKIDTKWTNVSAIDAQASAFELNVAANLPVTTLTTLAHLIFMTTTGRRADVLVATSETQLYLACEDKLVSGSEYVLIDIRKRDVAFKPAIVPSPVEIDFSDHDLDADVIPLSLLG